MRRGPVGASAANSSRSGIATAPRGFHNARHNPVEVVKIRRSTLLKASRFGDFLRSTSSWWRSVRISASSETLDRNSVSLLYVSDYKKGPQQNHVGGSLFGRTLPRSSPAVRHLAAGEQGRLRLTSAFSFIRDKNLEKVSWATSALRAIETQRSATLSFSLLVFSTL